jgi:Ca2+-binding RTX toxin-like protein
VTTFFNGTNGNDSFVGNPTDTNIFLEIGRGADRALGGLRNDRFVMTIDQNVDFVDGGAGRDTIDYSASTLGLDINLSTGVVQADLSAINPLLPDVTVAQVRNIEDVVGSRFNGTITGSAADNRLDGGAGNDVVRAGAGNDTLIGGTGTNTLDGGTGTDTADYSSAGHSVFAVMGLGVAGEIDFETGTTFSQDSLISIENINGSRFADYLIGTAGDNVMNGGGDDDTLAGMGGNDTIHGGAGNDYVRVGTTGVAGNARLFGDEGDDTIEGGDGADILDGGIGNDYMHGGAGNDTLAGGAGNDHLEGSFGADAMDGGAGSNTLVYRHSDDGVTVNLANQTATGGDATGDTFSNVQNVWGSQEGNDVLIGSSGDNAFFEQGGNNTLVGGLGRDTFAFDWNLDGGSNLVADYQLGVDRLAFVHVDGMEDLNFTQIGAGTLVTYDDYAGSILLLGVNTQSLLQNADANIVFTESLEPIFGY